MIRLNKLLNESEKRIARKPGQHKGSSKHSDLYTDENPKGTIHGLKFATVKDAKASVNKIKASGKSHAHKIQAAIAMEQRAKAAGKTTAAAVYRSYINSIKKTEKMKLSNLLKEKPGDATYKNVKRDLNIKLGEVDSTKNNVTNAEADVFISDVLNLGSKNNLFDKFMKKEKINPNELSALVMLVANRLKEKWAK